MHTSGSHLSKDMLELIKSIGDTIETGHTPFMVKCQDKSLNNEIAQYLLGYCIKYINT